MPETPREKWLRVMMPRFKAADDKIKLFLNGAKGAYDPDPMAVAAVVYDLRVRAAEIEVAYRIGDVDQTDTHDEPTRGDEPEATTDWAAAKNPAPWASVHDMAKNAPLKDLGVAMAVYMSRIDEALN